MDTQAVVEWFDAHERPLPWRRPGTSAWGVLLSEVMSQQTPVARVAPQWEEWMRRWPTPQDLAAASKADVLRAWGKLGYPRRALRLWECAKKIGEGEVPGDVDKLLALPGIGEYTARAVACFHFGHNVPVVDTNVRRVYARAEEGRFLAPTPAKRELAQVEALLPEENGPRFSAALMELGALVCTAKNPDCAACPIKASCTWQLAGCPEPSEEETARAKKRVQKFTGTDRQVRGLLLDVLRGSPHPVAQADLDAVWPDAAQRSRAQASLLEDGLMDVNDEGLFHLPH